MARIGLHACKLGLWMHEVLKPRAGSEILSIEGVGHEGGGVGDGTRHIIYIYIYMYVIVFIQFASRYPTSPKQTMFWLASNLAHPN